MENRNIVIFDLDNTLLDDSHRRHLAEEKKWDEYFQACDQDKPIFPIIDIYKQLQEMGYELWILTGRSEVVRDKTLKSLSEYGIEFDNLIMRKVGVRIPDYNLKPSWIEKNNIQDRVVAIFDDRERVIDRFRAKGYYVVDVNPIINLELNFNIQDVVKQHNQTSELRVKGKKTPKNM